MTKSRLGILSVCAALFACASLSAQTPPTLTLREAEQIALKNHPAVLAARYNALASNQIVREARSAYFPDVSADVTGSAANKNSRIGAGFLTDSRLFNRFGQGITVDQLITDLGRTKNLVASSRLDASAASENSQATRYDVLLSVDQDYFEVLRAQALVKVAAETVKERETVMDQVSAMVRNKLKSDLDLSFANVNLAQAKLLEIQAQNGLKIATADLARAMGSSTPRPYTLVAVPLPSAPPASAESLVTEALQNRPEIMGLRFRRNAAIKFQRAERDLALPTLSAVGVAGYIPSIEQVSLPHVIPDHYEGAALNLEVPVINGHLFAARREAAKLEAGAAGEGLTNEQQIVARDVRVAWANASTAYQGISVTATLLAEARQALSLAQGRYNLGLGSIVELSQAQLNETQAEIQAVNARYGFQSQNAALQYQVGLLR
ncbi:MAG: TolC family protein [Terriglobia bacterium]